IGRNDVEPKRIGRGGARRIAELRASRAISITRRRIVDFRRRFAEIAAEPFGVWSHEPVDESQLIGGVLIIAEIEEFVLFDRTANGRAGLSVMRGRRAMSEVISSLQPAVVVIAEEEETAVNIVRAGLERYGRDRAARAAELGVEVARRDA